MLLALVLTLSLCVNAIAELAGGSNEQTQGTEQAQGTEQVQEPEQTQSPKAQMVKFGMSKGDPDVTTDSLKPNDAVTIMLRDSGFTPPVPGVKYDEPFAVAEGGGMLRCDRYPQEGGNGQKWYFRLCVSRGDLPEGEVYTVYLPYSYLGIRDADAQKLIASGQKARIEHYADGDDMPPTIIEGTYTEWGICFKTSSFSPFVISTATAGTSSGTGSNTGTGSTTGTGSSAGSASATTGDAGIALYVGMAVSSAVGMAWVGKKKD